MPYENEHACRLNDPGKYKRFTRGQMKSKTTGKTYSVIYGWYVKDGKEVSEIQAIRYPKSSWSASEARSNCRSKDGRFEQAVKTQEMNVLDPYDNEQISTLCNCGEE